MARHTQADVVYVADRKLLSWCDAVPVFRHRARLTHALISSYGLLPKMRVVASEAASEEDVRQFHSQDYVEFLQKGVSEQEEERTQDEFGLGFDCPILDNLWGLVCGLAGGSLTAARELSSGRARIAVNWCGGWHHAQRDMASGFCYVNDIVLAVLQLRSVFPKVLYIDLDVHHGDGVESAFLFSPKVVTVSLHQWEAGFFPGTGARRTPGWAGEDSTPSTSPTKKASRTPNLCTCLRGGMLYPLCEVFLPDAVVCQCGGDALSRDPVGGGNLTLGAYTTCVTHVLNLAKPTLFLGGGGYNKANTAKLWTAITATLLQCPLPSEIPEHQFFSQYGPDFELEVTAGPQRSTNTQESLDQTLATVHGHIERLAERLGQ
ncbi:Histone deacetylase 8 [Chionoecetes opilio]|uniref:Histone deacetylase n=1 Tax=Chionoecetes opilio TaxID=41210 RepID=A0A8J4YCT9_CHIOP|nr:Histone deacetylase 8 [Chionoecetes opilio]